MFKFSMYNLDKYISGLSTPIYWTVAALAFFFLSIFALSILGMLVPLLLFAVVLWFFMACMRDPRFDVITRKIMNLINRRR